MIIISALIKLRSKTAWGRHLVSVIVPRGLLVQEPDVRSPEEDVKEPDQDGGVCLGEASVDRGVAVANSQVLKCVLIRFVAGRVVVSEDVRLKCYDGIRYVFVEQHQYFMTLI